MKAPSFQGGNHDNDDAFGKKVRYILRRHCDGTVKSGKVSIMEWACFSNGNPGALIVCDSGGPIRLNADAYLKILEDGVVEFINTLLTRL